MHGVGTVETAGDWGRWKSACPLQEEWPSTRLIHTMDSSQMDNARFLMFSEKL